MSPTALVRARIENLHLVADRFEHPGGSRVLARRARDKAAGMETALRILASSLPAELTICPECAQGKHVNCDGTAWDNALDQEVPCACHDDDGDRP